MAVGCDGGKEDPGCDGTLSGVEDSSNLVISTGVDETGGSCMGWICSTSALEISVGWVPVPLFEGKDLSTVEFMVDFNYDVSELGGMTRTAVLRR